MALGPAFVALAVLIGPAMFATAFGRYDVFDHEAGDIRGWNLAPIALCAIATFFLSALGSSMAPLLPAVPGRALEVLNTVPQSPLDLAALLVPFAIATLTIISGFAGALVGLATRTWRPGRRITAAWFACLALIASFLAPFLIAVNSIVHHGAPAFWILVGPLALPLTLAGALAWRQREDLSIRFGAGPRESPSDAIDPEVLDRIVSEVAGQSEAGVRATSRTQSELEMAQLAAAIRHTAAPYAQMSESRVQEIVTGILAESPGTAPARSIPARQRFRASSAGVFCASWVCLAAGLLIVSPLGGVPPSVISAMAVGLLGSTMVLLIGRRHPAMGGTVVT